MGSALSGQRLRRAEGRSFLLEPGGQQVRAWPCPFVGFGSLPLSWKQGWSEDRLYQVEEARISLAKVPRISWWLVYWFSCTGAS